MPSPETWDVSTWSAALQVSDACYQLRRLQE